MSTIRITRPCRASVVALVAALVAAVAAAGASATPGSPVVAHFSTVSATTLSTRTADGNTFVTVERTAEFTGTIVGFSTDTILIVFHANGTASIRGAGTCVCTVAGRSGTVDYSFEGGGIYPIWAFGQYVFRHGTGDLAGLHVEGPWSSVNLNWTAADPAGSYHFD